MTQPEPYIEAHPGELITAQTWNEVQIDIKKDIADEIEAAKDDIRHTGVDKAKDADEFAGKTSEEWTGELDQRYAPKAHDHEGQSVWRRYIKRFTPKVNEALLAHELGRFPLVDVYELLTVATLEGKACKILFFSGHADTDELDLRVEVYRDRALRGIPFDQVAAQIGLEYNDDSSIADVVDDFWTQFMLDPNDDIEHCQTAWVDECCERNRTVGELKKAGDWDDLFIGLNPHKVGFGPASGTAVDVSHVNYDTLYLRANFPGAAPAATTLDLMLLLRI